MKSMARSRWQRKARLASEKARKMGLASQAAQRARREAEMPERMREMAEIDVMNLPRREGDALGCLQWMDFRTGKCRRWIFRIGDRADRVTMEAMDGRRTLSHGWTWVMDRLRGHLAGRR